MKKRLMNVSSIASLLVCALLSACSTVKDLTNVDLSNMKVWSFGSSADAPRVYQPANSVPYMCEGNKKFFVRMLDKGASAWLILSDREVLLAQSGTSKVYTNGISKLDLSSEDVTLDVNETTRYVACKANGVAKVSKVEPSKPAVVEPVVVPVVKQEVKPESKQEVPPVVAVAPTPTPEPQVVGAKPEAVAEQATASDEKSSSQAAVTSTLDAWANAWRTKNVNAYLGFYSAKFKPEGVAKAKWIAQRKQRVGANPAEIALSLEKVNVVADAKKAEVSFVQHYTSGKFSDTVAKVLNFENENGHWMIVKETSKSQK